VGGRNIAWRQAGSELAIIHCQSKASIFVLAKQLLVY
jgi:hypothetical protein